MPTEINDKTKRIKNDKTTFGKYRFRSGASALGSNVFGWTIDEKTSFDILDGFVDAGMNLVDTADVYSSWKPGNEGGESETIIGNWMHQRGNRSSVIVATKVGGDMGQGKKDISKRYILQEVEQSLKRLQTDYIDLYQTQWDDDTTAVEETLEAYEQLKKEGKVRWIGASNLSIDRLKLSIDASEQHGYPRYETFQPLYNLYDRAGFEQTYQSYCAEQNISTITYFSLASGFLTGKYRSEDDLAKSARGGGNKKYLTERGFRILEALDKISKEYGTVPASVSLAWLMTRPSVAAPIASATNRDQLMGLIGATKLQLSEESLQVLNDASKF